MNPTLRAFLAAVLVTGSGAVVYTYATSTTTFTDLQGANIAVDCNPRLIVCAERINPVLRNRLADAGYVLPAQRKYARVVRQAHRCPNPDGGVAELIVPGFERFAVDQDDAAVPEPVRCVNQPCTDLPGFCGGGPKNVGLMPGAPDCVRAPVAGGALCQRSERDGGFRYFGAGNVFPVGESNGHASCEPVDCAVMFGDNPDTDL